LCYLFQEPQGAIVTKNGKAGWKHGMAMFFAGCAALLVAACGGDSDGGGGGSDDDQINRLVREFFDGTIKGEGDEAYDLLSAESQGDCSRQDFIEQSELAQELFDAIGSEVKVNRVYDIKISGDTATAKIEVTVDGETSGDEIDDAEFVRENGRWKVNESC
jgi:hypothetical protein